MKVQRPEKESIKSDQLNATPALKTRKQAEINQGKLNSPKKLNARTVINQSSSKPRKIKSTRQTVKRQASKKPWQKGRKIELKLPSNNYEGEDTYNIWVKKYPPGGSHSSKPGKAQIYSQSFNPDSAPGQSSPVASKGERLIFSVVLLKLCFLFLSFSVLLSFTS